MVFFVQLWPHNRPSFCWQLKKKKNYNWTLTKSKTKSLHETSSSKYKEMLYCWFVWRVFPATAVCDPADSTTPHSTRLKIICMLETPQQRAPSPLGIVLSGWKTSGTHGGLLFKPQIDSNRKKEGISLFLTFCLTPSVSHCLQETDYISTKAVRMREWACGRRMWLQKLGRLKNLFPLNAPERFKQDKALVAERKKGS